MFSCTNLIIDMFNNILTCHINTNSTTCFILKYHSIPVFSQMVNGSSSDAQITQAFTCAFHSSSNSLTTILALYQR